MRNLASVIRLISGYAFAFLVLKSFIVIIHSNSFFKPLSFMFSGFHCMKFISSPSEFIQTKFSFISLVYFINFPLNSIQLNPINLQFKHQFDSMSWIKIEWLNDWLMDLLKLNAGNSVSKLSSGMKWRQMNPEFILANFISRIQELNNPINTN